MRHDPTFWLLARASGLTAYVMLTLSVLAGLVIKSRPFRSLKPAAVTDLHRILAMLGLGALAGHATALVLDTTVHGLAAGTDSSRPWAFGLYVVAVAAVAAATAWRIMVPPVSARARRPIAPRQEQPA